MANFDVSIRRELLDIGGLAGLWRPFDFEITNNRITRWFNRATKLKNRFGDLVPVDAAAVTPVLGPNGGARHTIGSSATDGNTLVADQIGDISGLSENWSFGFSFRKNFQLNIPQQLLAAAAGSLSITRRGIATGDYGYVTGAGQVDASGDIPDGGHLWSPNAAGTLDWLVDNVAAITAGALDPFEFGAPGNGLRIGAPDSTTDALGGELTDIAAWKRKLSPKERDLIFKFLSIGGVDNSAGVGGDPRAAVENRPWTDDTGDLTLRQVNRVNPQAGRPQFYTIATIPSGEAAAIVQFAANTTGGADGTTVAPDADLAGDLYQLSFIEKPTLVAPQVTQDAGWSSIFDVRVVTPGHYTLLFERPNNGAMYVHLDVEKL